MHKTTQFLPYVLMYIIYIHTVILMIMLHFPALIKCLTLLCTTLYLCYYTYIYIYVYVHNVILT